MASIPTGHRSPTGPDYSRKISTPRIPGSSGTCWCVEAVLVIPGRRQRVRAKRDPMTGSASNPESRDSGFASSTRPGMTASPLHIIERHGPEPERQIRLEMQCGDHFAHWQPRHIGKRVREQAERRWAGPCLFQHDVFEMEAHQLANPRAAIDMGNDLEDEIRRLHAVQHGVMIGRTMLVAHGGGG